MLPAEFFVTGGTDFADSRGYHFPAIPSFVGFPDIQSDTIIVSGTIEQKGIPARYARHYRVNRGKAICSCL